MVDILHSAPADGDATAMVPAETLTLHRDVASRWDAAGRLGVLSQSRALAAVAGRHDWIKGLSGLGALGGGFGPQAWNLATQIAVSPELLARMTTQTRSLQVGELADLVQIVLEELELDGEGAELEAEFASLHRELQQSQAKAAPSAARTQQAAQRRAAKGGAVAKGSGTAKGNVRATRTVRPQAAVGKLAQLRDLRRLVQQLRATAISADEAASFTPGRLPELAGAAAQDGVQQPHPPTLSGLPVPAESAASSAGTADSRTEQFTRAALRALHPAGAISGGQARADLGGASRAPGRRPALASLLARPARLGTDTAAHPLWTLGETSLAARAPRALRWAEASADRALLETAAEAEQFASGEAVQQAAGAGLGARSRTPTTATPAGRPSGARVGATLSDRSAAGSAQTHVGSAATFGGAALTQGGSPLPHRAAAAIWRASQVSPATRATGAAPQPAVAAAQRGQPGVNAGVSPVASGTYPEAAQAAGGSVALTALRAAAVRARQIVARAEAAARFGAVAEAAPLSHWQRYFQAADAAQTGSSPSSGPAAGAARAFAPGLAAAGWQDAVAPASIGGGRVHAARAVEPQAAGAARFEAAAGDLVAIHDELGGDGAAIAHEQQTGAARQRGSATSAPRLGPQAPTTAGLDRWWTSGSAPAAAAGLAKAGRRTAGAAFQSQAAAGTGGAAAVARSAFGQPAPAGLPAQAPGLVGLAAIGLGQRLDSRVSMGLAPADRSAAAVVASTLAARAWPASAAAPAAASQARQRQTGATIAAVGSGPSIGNAGVRPERAIAGGLQPGVANWQGTGDTVGEWLDLGVPPVEGGFDAVSEQTAAPASARLKATASLSRRAAGSAPALTASPALTAARSVAPAALAAQAAVAALVRARAQARTAVAAGGGAAAAPAVAAMAGLRELGVLAARPAGRVDSLSAWVAQAAARSTAAQSDGSQGVAVRSTPAARLRALRTEQAGAGEWLDLGAGDTADALTGELTASVGAGQGGAPPRAAAATAGNRGTVGPQAIGRRATPAALGADTPQALKAMLKAWGETAGAPADAAAAFVARFLGRGDVAREVAQRMAAAATTRRELVAAAGSEAPTAAVAGEAQRPVAGRAGRPGAAPKAVQATAQGDEIVLSGMAALAALTGGDLFGPPKGRERAMATPEAARELLTPGAVPLSAAGDDAAIGDTSVRGAASASSGSKAAAPAPAKATPAARALAGVQMHTFAPVGLRRGQNLLGQSRRARWLHATPRGTFATRLSSARSAARSGYASASFSYGGSGAGASELVGLSGGDGGWYLGESAPAPTAVRGADRLSAEVAARRSASIGRSPGAASHAAGPSPVVVDGMALPTDFRVGQDLVNPAAGLDAMVEAANRSAGATASHKGTQAAAMTRVLSVTAAPTANMLPLVAPAAQAIVAAAAAKPLSEGIATSGGDPTYGTPIVGVGDHKAGKAGQGAGGDKARQQSEDQSSSVQDIEALAVKVARSVMVRIKRERERRGLHV